MEFNTRVKFLVKMLVGYVKIPTREETQAILDKEVDVNKMRNKIIKFVNDKKNLYLNYLENYRIS